MVFGAALATLPDWDLISHAFAGVQDTMAGHRGPPIPSLPQSPLAPWSALPLVPDGGAGGRPPCGLS